MEQPDFDPVKYGVLWQRVQEMDNKMDTDESLAGSSAQDWQALLPEVVIESDDEQKT